MNQAKEEKYCCVRFADSVREGVFVHSEAKDETEWFIPRWYHLYYCPFCGQLIKGEGTGEFNLR